MNANVVVHLHELLWRMALLERRRRGRTDREHTALTWAVRHLSAAHPDEYRMALADVTERYKRTTFRD